MAQYVKTEEGYKEFAAVTDNKMDKTNPTGTGSFSMNRKAGTVIGENSHAEGERTTASGDSSHAEGYQAIASGGHSHAEGNDTTASGGCSHAEGERTTASGAYSHAEGERTTASGDYSHAEGLLTIASREQSHAEGYHTTASGEASHAEGYLTTSSGFCSHAEGYQSRSRGKYSHAEGGSTNAFSSVVTTTNPTTDSIITAWETKKFSVAHGFYSHVEGKDNLALDYYSHAEGYETVASGEDSHAEGYETVASGDDSHAQGKFNIEDTSSIYADIIGNGTSDTARSNAATVDWNGNAWYAGDVYTGSTSGTNKDDGSKKLATEEYVNNSIAANSVLYTTQSLTEEQKAQARQNIGSFDFFEIPNFRKFAVKTKALIGDKIIDGEFFALDDFQPIDINTADAETVEAWRTLYHYFSFKPMQQFVSNPFALQALALLIDKNMFGENFYSTHDYSNPVWFGRNKKFMQVYSYYSNDAENKVIAGFVYDLEQSLGQFKYNVLTNTIEYYNYSSPLTAAAATSTDGKKLMDQIDMRADPTEPMQIATKQYIDNAIANIPATDLSKCVQTDKENILGDNGSIISNSSRGNSLTISNGVIEQKNSNQDTVSLGNAKVVFSHDNDGSSSTKGNGTFTMYGRKGEEYFKFNGTNGDVRVSGIATPTLSNDAVNKGYVDSQIATIEIPTVPTNVSAFTNDAGYLTAVPSEYITETELNAKGYLTEHQSLADYALKSEIPSPYSLPTASATELGGVKADSAEAADTQPVRIGGDGKLYTAAGGGTYYVELNGSFPNYTLSDTTPLADITAAYNDGKVLFCRCSMGNYTATLPLFVPATELNTWIFSGSGGATAMSFPAQYFTIVVSAQGVTAEDKRLVQTDAILTSVSASSTDSEVPSAKCVYDLLGNVTALIDAM